MNLQNTLTEAGAGWGLLGMQEGIVREFGMVVYTLFK